jgi:hypothetical protein
MTVVVVVVVVVHPRLSKYGVAAIEPEMPPTAFPIYTHQQIMNKMQTTLREKGTH